MKMERNLTFATRCIGLFWRENGSCSSRLKESQWVSEPLYDYFRRNRILDEGLRFLKRRSQCTMTATKPSKKCALVTQFFFASFLVSVVVIMVALSSLVAFPCNTTISNRRFDCKHATKSTYAGTPEIRQWLSENVRTVKIKANVE